jgi:hypothetical protein
MMPAHNFMFDDLAGCLMAVALFPLFLACPGYAIAWLLDLFEFRQRTLAFRIALSIPLSVAMCPIVTYLAGRFGSWNAIGVFYAASAVYFLVVFARQLRKEIQATGVRTALSVPKELRIFVVISAVWLAAALFSLIDIQIGDRLYYPVNSYDNSVHTEFVHSISATGIPPQNPFYLAGHRAPLRYHYFWLMMCSLVERAGMGAITSRQALIGSIFWCGMGLMALVSLYLRLFAVGDPARYRRRALTGILLLGITGLDILPTLFLVTLYAKGLVNFVLPSVELWNEQVAWFIFSVFGSTHAVASMLACFMGFLLLWKAPAASGWRGILKYSLPASVALASSIGASIYVAFVFAVFLTLWTGVTVWKKWYRETAALAPAGIGCAVLISPYLWDMLQGSGSGGGAPLKFTVRAFAFAHLMPGWSGMTPGWRLILANGPMVPLNYLLELGLFFLVGLIQLRRYRGRSRALSRQELATAMMAGVSILICTFLRSSVIENNDLGWRGFLIAEFVLLLWGVDVLLAGKPLANWGRLLRIFVILGAAGSIYDLAINRFYPVLADNGAVPPIPWMSRDRQFGKRTYASRSAYRWAQTASGITSSIQYNPNVVVQETPAMLYSDRSFIASDLKCNAAFGGDPALCAAVVSRLVDFYATKGKPDAQRLQNICQNVPADLLIARDTDAVWTDRSSWVWTERPVFANPYVRLFGCPKRVSGAIAAR